ncbi:hypothetical protein SAMN05421788_11817 [Filimonas lacunae]|uniref:Uncharacterized protein n=1 Tax=Filimonas lacunae TaxID=477680 RepID=A0A173MBD2_9BACT|nr:DUF6624 domain-containing protein [Filimonas lacunae]BAV04864.1 hypothetical protein FLA_0864 [Filimonas lacunae]SIT34648.1 hypothetical protein SAMN05421788_11817 [Filimonas lacunae]
MRLLILAPALLLLPFTNQAQQSLNIPLQKELDSILRLDQHYREILSNHTPQMEDSLSALYKVSKDELFTYIWHLQEQADSSNLLRIEAIIQQYGYPGKTLVDSPANESALMVIQHSTVIDKYLPVIKTAAEKKEVPFHLYAMMLDRSLMYQGKPQVYGTQGKGLQALDPATGKKTFKLIIWPVQDAALVNERRKAAGFSQSIEENAKRLGITYIPLTIEDVHKMEGKK